MNWKDKFKELNDIDRLEYNLAEKSRNIAFIIGIILAILYYLFITIFISFWLGIGMILMTIIVYFFLIKNT